MYVADCLLKNNKIKFGKRKKINKDTLQQLIGDSDKRD